MSKIKAGDLFIGDKFSFYGVPVTLIMKTFYGKRVLLEIIYSDGVIDYVSLIPNQRVDLLARKGV